MAMSVTRRRRRVAKTAHNGMDDALEECARSMAHGEFAVIHDSDCPTARNGVCDCRIEWLGPANRSFIQ